MAKIRGTKANRLTTDQLHQKHRKKWKKENKRAVKLMSGLGGRPPTKEK